MAFVQNVKLNYAQISFVCLQPVVHHKHRTIDKTITANNTQLNNSVLHEQMEQVIYKVDQDEESVL